MKKILDYLKISAVLVAVLSGVQVPTFLDQYGKNLGARYSESGRSVGEFQDDADRYFGGDINELIEHYESKGDPVIVAGGESLGAMVSRNKILKIAQAEYSESTLSAYTHVFFSPVPEIQADTWANFTYSVVLNKAAIVSAVVCGVVTLMLFELTFFLLSMTIRALKQSSQQEPGAGVR